VHRQSWLDERRSTVAAFYDSIAPTYDNLLYPTDLQNQWLERMLAFCGPNSLLLDAPCGTGKYFQTVASAGHRIVGIDESASMLEQARARDIAVSLERMGLLDLSYVNEFDAAMTIDSMENVAPEDWPLVLANLQRALRPHGLLYITVEELDDAVVDDAFERLVRLGIPAVRGEVVEGDVAGYHYYPGPDRVIRWCDAAGLEIVDQGHKREEEWAYHHLLLRAR
jgi:ubiquinone/menaquinone biosynthesis C-methylase UbiE